MLFRVCPLTMRTHGILLVRDVVVLLEEIQDSGKCSASLHQEGASSGFVLVGIGERLSDWRQSCDHLASSLDDYSDTLMIRLGEFDKANDTEGASIIRNSCIACLSHLAILYYFLGETLPGARATMNRLCDAVLDNLGNVTQSMKLEEVTLFDLLIKVHAPDSPYFRDPADILTWQCSWTKALKVYDSRIGSLSLEEGAQLWFWKQVVEGACVDLEMRMPKCEPPVLTSLALLEDGRSEGSKYPNLMVPAAREHYGI